MLKKTKKNRRDHALSPLHKEASAWLWMFSNPTIAPGGNSVLSPTVNSELLEILLVTQTASIQKKLLQSAKGINIISH